MFNYQTEETHRRGDWPTTPLLYAQKLIEGPKHKDIIFFSTILCRF
jgi:hypothetical protein